MLVNLSPKNNFHSMREKQKRDNRKYENGMTRKEKAEWGVSKIDTRFESLFTPTEFTGVYMSVFNEDTINIWCKQYAPYGSNKYYSRFSSLHDKIQCDKNCWFYGVADSLEQIIDFYNKNEDGFFNGNHVISTFEVHKNPEHSYSGWRWHKWGPYIGIKNPSREYLNDEPEIEKVICFSIYKVH